MTNAVHTEIIRLALPGGPNTTDAALGTERKPPSITSGLTAGAGFLAANILMASLWGSNWSVAQKTLAVVMATALAMIVVEIQNGSLLLMRPVTARGVVFSQTSLNRLFRKLFAQITVVLCIAFLYSILPEYSGSFYNRFWEMLGLTLPFIAVSVPFYFVYVDACQSDPEDAYAQLGALLTAQSVPCDWAPIRNLLLGWLVKAFFLPLMVVYLCGNLDALWATEWSQIGTMKGVWDTAYNYL
ncbi:hypothetical protein WDZ92_46010, partial [Nostoc sp. NIES-2111]